MACVDAVLLDVSNHTPAALHDTGNVRLASEELGHVLALVREARLATEHRFVGLNLTRQTISVLRHEFTPDEMAHAPRRLVRHAQLALDLLRGDSATSACHQIHRVEPKLKRG